MPSCPDGPDSVAWRGVRPRAEVRLGLDEPPDPQMAADPAGREHRLPRAVVGPPHDRAAAATGPWARPHRMTSVYLPRAPTEWHEGPGRLARLDGIAVKWA
jgi:hypothetical protein